ncbi:MAG: PEP-CTERM sorting domain-containing protein [Phycisphaeraceae bacterium]|nr:PEP-CTERM sorting domain-containing protein [Phycisphaeraceae bacterium]
MPARLLTWAVVCCLFASFAQASPVLSLNAPENYVPGGSFDVAIRLTDAQDLNLFGVRLIISSPTGVAGTDYGFVEPVPEPFTDPEYVFHGLSTYFSYGPGVITVAIYSTAMLEAPTASVDTYVGHDLLSRIGIWTTAGFSSPITVAVDDQGLELLRPLPDEFAAQTPIDGFSSLLSALPSVQVSAIPEPASLSMLLLAGVMGLRRRSPSH